MQSNSPILNHVINEDTDPETSSHMEFNNNNSQTSEHSYIFKDYNIDFQKPKIPTPCISIAREIAKKRAITHCRHSNLNSLLQSTNFGVKQSEFNFPNSKNLKITLENQTKLQDLRSEFIIDLRKKYAIDLKNIEMEYDNFISFGVMKEHLKFLYEFHSPYAILDLEILIHNIKIWISYEEFDFYTTFEKKRIEDLEIKKSKQKALKDPMDLEQTLENKVSMLAKQVQQLQIKNISSTKNKQMKNKDIKHPINSKSKRNKKASSLKDKGRKPKSQKGKEAKTTGKPSGKNNSRI
jgi:hypothetical protein